nr:phosphotransferase [Qipengyuania sp. YIM B01966]
MTLSYDGPQGDSPGSLAAKFPAADPASRHTAVTLGLYAKEVGFYREIAPQIAVRSPRALVAEIADDAGDFILLFEDLSPLRGGDQIAGCTLADARTAIRAAAAIHAPSWENPAIVEQPWLHLPEAVVGQIRALYPQAQAIFRERYADLLEPEYMVVCDGLAARADRWFGRQSRTRCLVHGDFRLDNILFDIRGGTEPIAVVDWQTATIGSGLTDIGYFMGCGIGADLAGAHEDQLLGLYCAEMTARGVPLGRADIEQEYRLGALHGVSTAVFSAAFVERTARGDANFLSMARGACALAARVDSLGALVA